MIWVGRVLIQGRFEVLAVTSVEMTSFWDIAPCSLVEVEWSVSTRLHGAISQKAVVFIHGS
jgi:hypothetical protein